MSDTSMGARAAAVKAFIADLARPFALYSVAGSTSFAIVNFALEPRTDLSGAAVFLTAALGGTAALYGAKALELTRIAGHSAEVEKVRAAASPPPAAALAPAEAAPPPGPDAGELSADQRVNP